MRRTIVAALMTMLCVVMSWGADTLTIARKTSTLSIPLQRGSIECSIDAQMPATGGVTLYNNLTQRLNQAVAKATGIKNMEKVSGDVHMPALSDMESSFVKHITTQMATQTRDAKAYNLTLDVAMQREYETAKLITFRIEVIYYGVDNQRHQLVDRVSLLKQSGKTLQWSDIINKKQKAKFCKAAAKSLYPYFGTSDFINMQSQLKDGQSIKQESFPLPDNGVAVTADGLCLVYAPDEIAGAERGQPMGTIRLQSVWGCLTSTAKGWMK